MLAASLPVIRASGGRAFLLFTTLRAMRLAHRLLRAEFDRAALSYPLLLQGQGSRSELLERFRLLGNAVLIGSATADAKGAWSFTTGPLANGSHNLTATAINAAGTAGSDRRRTRSPCAAWATR